MQAVDFTKPLLVACAVALIAPPALGQSRVPQPPESLRLSAPADTQAQLDTVNDIRMLGKALMSWVVDRVADQTSQVPVRVRDYQRIAVTDLIVLLVPQYIHEVPDEDGWGNKLEIYLNLDNVSDGRVPLILIRSPGRNGVFDFSDYMSGSFDGQFFDHDIVWSDGFFTRWPMWLRAPEPVEGENLARGAA